METTMITAEWTVAAVDVAITFVEGLLSRPREQSLFSSEDLIDVLDRVDFALLLAPVTPTVDLPGLAEISAAARYKAEGQPAVDAAVTKGDTLLDLWSGLVGLRSSVG